HRELEQPRRRGGVYARMCAARDVQVDPARRDRPVEDVEGDVTEHACAARVALEVEAAEGEVGLQQAAARLADHRGSPLAPELVAVAVEEDVHLLLDGLREEDVRIGSPEDS